MANKRGEHCLQMWVWDMKEHCVRAYKKNSLSTGMGKIEVGGGGGKGILIRSLLYSIVGKGHKIKAKQNSPMETTMKAGQSLI